MRNEITPQAAQILRDVFAAAGVELARTVDGFSVLRQCSGCSSHQLHDDQPAADSLGRCLPQDISGVSGNAVERRGSIRRRNGVSNELNPLGVPPPPAFAGASRQET